MALDDLLVLAKLNGEPEIFLSIQGEGRNAGVPSVFVRTSGCNLQCVWCDSDYTWNFAGTPYQHKYDALPDYQKYDRADVQCRLTIEQTADAVRQFDCRQIILTGGEPLLQADGLAKLIGLLRHHDPGYAFEFETNGTRLPPPSLELLGPRYNVSPKLSNSRMERTARWLDEPMKFFAAHPKAGFKFVCQNEQDLEEIQALVSRFQIPADRVILMPEGTSAAEIAERREWIINQCLKFGYRFSDRLHIAIYGNRRGI